MADITVVKRQALYEDIEFGTGSSGQSSTVLVDQYGNALTSATPVRASHLPILDSAGHTSQTEVESTLAEIYANSPTAGAYNATGLLSGMTGKIVNAAAYSSLANAIAALPSGGGKVIIPPGTYTFTDTLLLSDNVTIEGSGINNTTLQYNGTGDAMAAATASGHYDWIRLSDFRLSLTSSAANGIDFDGIGHSVIERVIVLGGTNANGIHLNSSSGTPARWCYYNVIRDCQVYNNSTGIRFSGYGAAGEYYSGANENRVHNCDVNSNTYGIYIDQGDNIYVSNCNFEGNTNTAVYIDDVLHVVVSHSRFEGNGTDVNGTTLAIAVKFVENYLNITDATDFADGMIPYYVQNRNGYILINAAQESPYRIKDINTTGFFSSLHKSEWRPSSDNVGISNINTGKHLYLGAPNPDNSGGNKMSICLPISSNVASSGELTLSDGVSTLITGTTNITSIAAASAAAGKTVILRFASALTVTHGNNLYLKGDFTSFVLGADNIGYPMLGLICDGTNWLEIFRNPSYQTWNSVEFDLSAAAATDWLHVENYAIRIKSVTYLYTETSGAGNTTIKGGKESDDDYYWTAVDADNGQTENGQSQYYTKAITLQSDLVVAAGDTLVLTCAGGSLAAGKVKVIVEYF